MIAKLINPFKYIAGGKSLILGILVLLATGVTGYFSHTHFPDLVSVKVGANFPILYFIIQSLANWFVFSLLLWLSAIIASKSSVRLVDVLGTQALARFPYFIAAFFSFSGALEQYGKYLIWKNLQVGEPIEITTSATVTAIIFMFLTIMLTVWMVTLMYNAFRVSTNLKGPKLYLIFIGVFIVAELITINLTNFLINIFT